MIDLRFIERVERTPMCNNTNLNKIVKILQWRQQTNVLQIGGWTEWQDVPVVKLRE